MSVHANIWRDSAEHLFLGLYGVMSTSTFVASLLEPPWLSSGGPDSAKHAMDDSVPYQQSPTSLFSRASSTADDDFFNEPSTMRPQMTAAAAQKDEDSRTQNDPSTLKANTYDLTARGTQTVHKAAPVA